MPTEFKVAARKIVIAEDAQKLLSLWEKTLSDNGIKKEDHSHLYLSDSHARKLNMISKVVKKAAEAVTNEAHGTDERELPGFTFQLEVNCKETLDLYRTCISEILFREKIDNKTIETETIKSHKVLLGELLIRLAAQILCNTNIADPKNDHTNKYLEAFSAFCKALQDKGYIYNEGTFTNEPLFGDAVTPFAIHIGSSNQWESYFALAVEFNNTILKARNAATSCNNFFDELIVKVKQQTYVELESKINECDLHPNHIDSGLKRVKDKLAKKFDHKDKKMSMKREQMSKQGNLNDEQCCILASINEKSKSKLKNGMTRIENLKQLFQFLNVIEKDYQKFKSLDRIITATGWISILFGILDLDGFKNIITRINNEKHVLHIDDNCISGLRGKEILASGTKNIASLGGFAISASDYLNKLENPEIHTKILEMFKNDINYLSPEEKGIGFRLIKVDHLPPKFRDCLGLNERINATVEDKKVETKQQLMISQSEQATHVQSAPRFNIPGLDYQSIPGDGHCLYHAVGMYLNRDQESLRNEVACYVEHHIEEFRYFLENGKGQTVEDYIKGIRQGKEWAGNAEIEILMRVFKRPILMIGPNGRIQDPTVLDRYKGKPIFVFYNKVNHYDAYVRNNKVSSKQILKKVIQLHENSHQDHRVPRVPKDLELLAHLKKINVPKLFPKPTPIIIPPKIIIGSHEQSINVVDNTHPDLNGKPSNDLGKKELLAMKRTDPSSDPMLLPPSDPVKGLENIGSNDQNEDDEFIMVGREFAGEEAKLSKEKIFQLSKKLCEFVKEKGDDTDKITDFLYQWPSQRKEIINTAVSWATMGAVEHFLKCYTPLALAAAYNKPKRLAQLLEYGGDPKLKNGRDKNLSAMDCARHTFWFDSRTASEKDRLSDIMQEKPSPKRSI